MWGRGGQRGGGKAEEESERRFRGNHRARGKEGIVMVTTGRGGGQKVWLSHSPEPAKAHPEGHLRPSCLPQWPHFQEHLLG